MKVSIITVCYNRNKTIANCIKSVLNQDYLNIEYIIIDGNSSDGTKETILSLLNKNVHFISETDQGLYDAINKGLKLITGDIVGLLHSDDTLYDSSVISKIVSRFKESELTDAVYGNGIYIQNNSIEKIVRTRISGQYNFEKIKCGWLPLHPTVYIKRSLIEKYGGYNLNFKIASDTEFLLRYFYKHKISVSYINHYIIKFKMGGLSTSYVNMIKILYEDYKIYKQYEIPATTAVFKKKKKAFFEYLKK